MSNKYTKLANANPYYRNVITSNLSIPQFSNDQQQMNAISQVAQMALKGEGPENLDNTIKALNKLEFLNASKEAKAYRAVMLAVITYFSMGGIEKKYNQKYNFKSQKNKIQEYKNFALGIAPNNVDYLINFAIFEVKLGNTDEAIRLLKHAQSINPNVQSAYVMLAVIYNIEQVWDKAYDYAAILYNHKIEIYNNIIELSLSTACFQLGKPIEGRSDYDMLTIEKTHIHESLSYLPPVDGSFDHSFHDKPIIFIPCNAGYLFEHGLSLVLSAIEACPDHAIHLHIMNPNEMLFKCVEKLKQKFSDKIIQLTTETGDLEKYGGPTVYYAGIRPIRLYQLLKINNHRVTLIDADSLFKNNLNDVAGINDGDWVLSFFDDGNAPYWEMINCAMYTWKKSDAVLEMLERYAYFTAQNIAKKSFYWFSGQIAVSMLYDKFKDKMKTVKLINHSLYDLDHNDSSTVWGITNEKDDSKKYMDYKLGLLEKYGFKDYYLKNKNPQLPQ